PFTGVIAGGGYLGILSQAFLFNIVVKAAGQRCTEARQVGTTITLGNIVGIAEDVFLKRVVPLQRNLYADSIFPLGSQDVDNLIHGGFIDIQILNECLESTFVLKGFFLTAAFIFQQDTDTGVEE